MLKRVVVGLWVVLLGWPAFFRGKDLATGASQRPATSTQSSSTPSSSTQPASTQPASSQPDRGPTVIAWPHIRVDRKHRHVDLDAKVVLRESEWLELLACTPGTREHESILTTQAKPSHIHLALLSLGLKPGSPMKWRMVLNDFKVYPPLGPKVAVTILVTTKGKTTEVPANQWIIDQEALKTMQGNRWLFTGSEFVPYEGKEVYLADLNGNIMSLVNFGDDLLARSTRVTKDNDNSMWGPNTKLIPKLGTQVTIRLRPVDKAPQSQPAASRPGISVTQPSPTKDPS